jgi:3-phenylpropionate/cinnamic acid dioxygenase small subunit
MRRALVSIAGSQRTMHSDTDAIKEVLYRYSLMVDRRRWELIDEVFTSDATIDYTSVGSGGTKGPVRPMLEWLDQSLVPWPMNLHFITNEIIEIEGDRAKSTCCFNAPMGRKTKSGSQVFLTNAGYYQDELVRTEAGWRIRERVCDMTIQIFHGESPSLQPGS